MAVTVVLSEVQRAALAALCDTFAPSIERDDDPTGFWGRSASDLPIPAVIEEQLAGGLVPEEQLAGLRQLLDALADAGLVDAPQEAREQIVHGFMDSGPDALAGLGGMRGPDAPALLRDARSRDGPQPQLGGDRLPRAAQRAALARRGAEDDPRHAPERRRPRAHRRRRRRRLRLRRRRRRRPSRHGGQGRRRARGRRLLQRGRLQPARAVGLRAPLPRRRASRRPPTAARADDGLEPRRRLDGQLDQLPAPLPVGARGVGARPRARGPRRRRTSTASSTRSASASTSTIAARTTTPRRRRSSGPATRRASPGSGSRATRTRPPTTPTRPG